MSRRLLVVLGMLATTFVLAARADDRPVVKIVPKSNRDIKRGDDNTDPKVKIEDAAIWQESLKRRFDDFKQQLLTLAQRMENSAKAEDREKAKVLRLALKKASEEGVETQFSSLIEMLRGNGTDKNTEQLQSILQENEKLRQNLRAIMELLLKDDRDAQLRKDREATQKLLEELKAIIRKQELVQSKTIIGRTKNEDLAQSQKNVKDQTRNLVNPKSNQGYEAKPGEGKGNKPGKQGENKPGSGKPGAGKPGENKPNAGKSGQGKPGEGKPSKGGQSGQPGHHGQQEQQGEGKGGQQQPNQEQSQIKKQIQDAEEYQQQAEDKIRKDQRKDAPEDQDKALENLRAAQKKLEDLLRQLREEEIERLLAKLEARCRHMLALQIAVRDGTVELDKVIKANPKGEPTRAGRHSSNVLSDKENDIVKEARAGLRLLEAEGSAVAFAEVFHEVKGDMETVATRLSKSDTDVVTVTIENQIIDTLQEMIEALKRAQQENRNRQGRHHQHHQPPPQSDPRLIDLLAELKMIRSMQKRVNARTELYGKQYAGEQAPPPEKASTVEERERYDRIQTELKDLSKRQEKISKVTHDIATGKNEAQ
jgi:hypothetical protein